MTKDASIRPLPMILRRLPSFRIVRRIESHQHLHLAPQLSLTVFRPGTQAGVLRVERMTTVKAGERIRRHEQILRQIVERRGRTEMEEGSRRQSATDASLPLAAVPARKAVPGVLLRATAPAAPAVEPVPQAMSRTSWNVQPAALATAPDVEGLAERVIQQIDRRLHAHRERTGRR